MQQTAYHPSIKNLWLTVWTQPRAVIREVVRTNPGAYTLPVLIAAGVLIGLRSGILGLVFGPVMAFAVFYLFAFVLRWVGSWFGGRGTGETVRTATLWGYYLPTAQWRLVLIILTVVSNVLQFASAGYALLAFMGCMSVWTLTIYVRAVAEVHQFTVLKAIFSILITVFVVIAPFGVVFLALGGLKT